MPILHPAPPWIAPQGRFIELWHGCSWNDKTSIESNGVNPLMGRTDTDFGQGFYTTTVEHQARQWAWTRYYDRKNAGISSNQPVVLRFRVDRHALTKFSSLSFVMSDYTSDDFWSLVQHCRQSTPRTDPPPHIIYDHRGPQQESNGWWYDIVYGPVAAFWYQKSAMHDADQVSFHTRRSAQLLTDLIQSGDPNKYTFMTI